MNVNRRAACTAVLAGLFALPAPTRAAPPCERTLWGCPSRDKLQETPREPQAKYDQLCARGRRALRFTQVSGLRDLNEVVTDLTEAVRLFPEQPEGWALLGEVLLELGRWSEAEPALQRAEAIGEDELVTRELLPGALPLPDGLPRDRPAPARLGTLARLDPPLEVRVITSLAYIQALRGELSAALERTRRLLLRRGLSHRALWRLGDLLMAQGSLEEATASYERACTLPRSATTTTLELARACHGLLIALDRGERARAAFILRRATALDGDHRAIEMADIYPPYDREYYRALTLGPGCARRAAFTAYLREARQQPGVPAAYLRRAEEHLQSEHNQSCPPDL